MYVYFPVEWRFGENPGDGIGGQAVDDAGTLYIMREAERDEDWPDGYDVQELANKTTIAELIDDLLEGWADRDGYTHGDHVPASDALAAALRSAADKLDSCKRPDPCSRCGGPMKPAWE